MTLALRLLRGYVGTISATAVALASDGFWNDVAEPRAFTYNGKTYFGYVDDSGDIHVAAYDHSSRTTSTPFLVGSGFSSPSGDVHNSIAVAVRDTDQRLVVTMVEEGGQPSIRVSTNPEDATAWGSASSILDAGVYTYCSLVQNPGESDAMYYWGTHWPGSVSRLAYARSTDGGATWGGTNNIVAPVSPSLQIYHRVGTDQNDITHLFFTDTDRDLSRPSSVYHCYMQGFGNFYQSDGTPITGPFPITASSATLVQDTTYGAARPEGWAIDGSGYPACVINIRDGSTTELVRVARFDGASWTTHAVTSSVGQLISGSAMVKNDPNTLFIPRYSGTSGNLELWRYQSPDEGVTWFGTQLTSGSTQDNDAPDTPLNATALEVLWGYGTYTGPSFSFDVKGLAT